MKRVSKTEMAAIHERAVAMMSEGTRYFLIGEDGALSICFWSPSVGLMTMLIEDDSLAGCCVRHLLSTGALRFDDDAEALEHARTHSWPRENC